MKDSRSEFDRAASGAVFGEQAEVLWGALLEGATGRSRFELPNVAYYFGALVVISAMGWFMSDAPVRGARDLLHRPGLRPGLRRGGLGFARARSKRAGRVARHARGVHDAARGLRVSASHGDVDRGRPRPVRGGFRLDPGRLVRHGGGDGRRLPRRPALFQVPVSNHPLAFCLRFMSTDITPFLFGADVSDPRLFQKVSLFFGSPSSTLLTSPTCSCGRRKTKPSGAG